MIKKNQKNSGFSLIEILIAVGILVIGLTGILVLFPAGLFSTKKAIDETQATLIAESVYDSFSASIRVFNAEPLTVTNGIFQFVYDGIRANQKFFLPVQLNLGKTKVVFDTNGLLQPLGIIHKANPDHSDDDIDHSTFIPGNTDNTIHCLLGKGLVDPVEFPFNMVVSEDDNYLEQYSFTLEIKSPLLPENRTLYDIIIRIFRKNKLIYRLKTQVFISPPPGNAG